VADVDTILNHIASERSTDRLAPVTVIVPSRLALLQLRRRLAQLGAFANVRFEVVSRLAELVAAGALARSGRRPMARPIGDYAAWLVARESQGALAGVAEIDGYARALRQTFRRFRRAGFADSTDVPIVGPPSQLAEIARLFGRFRTLTSAFYDEEDLLQTAASALRSAAMRVPLELGAVYVVPPARLSAGADAFLNAVREAATSYVEVDESTGAPVEHFILAPDPESEIRCLVRQIVDALHQGVQLRDIVVLYSGDRAYQALIPQTFAAANIPVASMPGMPLEETAMGRGVLSLARLPLQDYSRAALFDFLSLAPVREWLPTADGNVRLQASQWLRLAREAGITHGLDRWHDALELFEEDRRQGLAPENELSDARRNRYESDLRASAQLGGVVQHLAGRLEPLRRRQRAGTFVPTFLALLDDYLRADGQGVSEVRAEVEQLGTVDSIGGDFDLVSFVESLQANLATASYRDRSLGDGILVTDYRQAAGLRFRRVFVCGAYEGVLPAATQTEPLLSDEVWSALRAGHPYVEDLERRMALAHAAAARVLGAAGGGVLTWSCPLHAAQATRDYYPSTPMLAAARRRDPTIRTASELRRAPNRDWLSRPTSPFAAMLDGAVVDGWEHRLRQALTARRATDRLPESHPLRAPLELLRARRSTRFSVFDGNLEALLGRTGPTPGASVSPTSLQDYAVCGMRYFLGSVLRLRGVDEPEETATISAAERGTLVHETLELFFRTQRARGRPAPGERWSPADVDLLLHIFDTRFEHLRRLGRAGLDIYAGFERRVLRADLAAFLDHDSDFRNETGAVPANFELRVPPTPVHDVNVTGFVDRIDRTPDGSAAYVIDYKTGKADDYENKTSSDPFLGGRLLQLPVYVLAARDAERVQAMYWFVTGRGEFKRVPYVETASSRERFNDTIGAILEGMRGGAFPAVSGQEDDFYKSFDNCRWCEFDRLCSRRRVYEFDAKQTDTSMEPWHRVAAAARGETST
jgi:hypothetical protein